MAPGHDGDDTPITHTPMPETRYPVLLLAAGILRSIHARPQTRAELAETYRVSELTIRRVLDGLIEAAVPITATRRGHGSGPLEYSTRVRL